MQRALEIVREWQIPLAILCVYYVIAGLVIRYACRAWTRRNPHAPRRHRIWFAIVLSLIFTPSVISDFFLFMIPGPAILGLLLILPGTIMHAPEVPSMLLVPLICHVFPLLLGAVLFYLALRYHDHRYPISSVTA